MLGVQSRAEVGISTFLLISFSTSFLEQADRTRRSVRLLLSWTAAAPELLIWMSTGARRTLEYVFLEFLLSCVATDLQMGWTSVQRAVPKSRIFRDVRSKFCIGMDHTDSSANVEEKSRDKTKEMAERGVRKCHPGIRSDSRRRMEDTQSPSWDSNPRTPEYEA